MAADVEPLEQRVIELEVGLEAALARLAAVEQDTRDLRQNVRGKLREHLADHADAGYDFRRWREQSGRPERPEDVAPPA